jgi:hypothetical protein
MCTKSAFLMLEEQHKNQLLRLCLVLLFQPASTVEKLNANQRGFFQSRLYKSSLILLV